MISENKNNDKNKIWGEFKKLFALNLEIMSPHKNIAEVHFISLGLLEDDRSPYRIFSSAEISLLNSLQSPEVSSKLKLISGLRGILF